MATAYKRLGATTVVANTNTKLYGVPGSTSTIVSTIAVCNRGASSRTFRIAHVDGVISGVSNEDYIVYDAPIAPNDIVIITIGITMEAAHELLVRANHADVNFICWGSELS